MMSSLLLILLIHIYHTLSATILLDNSTDTYVWDLAIESFGEDTLKPFSMEAGGTISVDISSTKLIDAQNQTCTREQNIYFIEIYLMNEDEFDRINLDTYNQHNCYDELDGSFDAQNCWYFTKATQKFFIPLNQSLTTTKTINIASKYRILIVNPCKTTYHINVR